MILLELATKKITAGLGMMKITVGMTKTTTGTKI